MKSLVKFQLLALAIMLGLVSIASAEITVTARPAQVPVNSYLNGGDGDHIFWQQIEFSPDVLPIIADIFTIGLPAGITIANTDDDLVAPFWADEIIVANYVAAGAAFALDAIATVADDAIIITAGAVGGFVAGDVIIVTFPIITSATAAAGLTYTVTASTALSVVGTSNTVSIVDSSLTLVDFDDANIPTLGTGKVTTNNLGRRHPDDNGGAVQDYTMAVLTDLLVDPAGGVARATVGATGGWFPFVALDNVSNNDELSYQLWASQTRNLSRVTSGSGRLVFDASTGAALAIALEGGVIQSAITDPTGAIDISSWAEGNWYFYLTSNATDEFVLSMSDTVEVRHYPTFMDLSSTPGFNLVATGAFAGAGDGIDYDHDGIFEPVGLIGNIFAGGDDASVTTLESGQTKGRSGAIVSTDNPAYDSVEVYWQIEDLDDNARVWVFKSANTGLLATDVTTGAGLVTGLTGATEITTTAQYEEDADNSATWTTYTSAAVFDAAADYAIYIVAYDTTNLTFKKVTEQTGVTALAVSVKHHPYFKFHDLYGPADDYAFDTALDQYYMISWGETINGDRDVDAAGTATIKLYYVPVASGVWNDIVTVAGGGDPTALAAKTELQTLGTLITTLTDDGDSQADNRYMWDLRAAALPAAASYDIWALMSHGTDQIVSQYHNSVDPVLPATPDTRSIAITNSDYMRPVTPYAGPPVELDQSDYFRMSWEAFSMEPTAPGEVQALLVLENSAADLGVDTWTNWDAVASNDVIWVVPGLVATGGEDQAPADGSLASLGSAIIDMSVITKGAIGGAYVAGNYDVYYFFNENNVFGAQNAIKAPGQIYLTNVTTTTFDIRLSPNKAHVAPGDILDVDIYANSDGTNPDKARFVITIANASKFTLVDQDAVTAGIQPFDNDLGTVTVAPNELLGEVLENSVTLDGDNWVLEYSELAAAAAPVTDADMVSFQLEMTAVIDDPLEDMEITFVTGADMTNLYNADGSAQATSIPDVAMAVKLGQAGKISGVVDVEGRDDKDEIVDFYVVPSGSVTPVTTASFLDANGDIDGTDGIQVTLQGGGYYELFGIPTGEYDIYVHLDRYANSIKENVRITSLGNTDVNFVGFTKLLGGDAAGYVNEAGDNVPNNIIDATDIQAITTATIGATVASLTWNTYADIDGDGTVEISDLFMTSKNVGTTGGGIFYKELPGSNDDAIVWLVLAEKSADSRTYTVKAKQLANLAAYSAHMAIVERDWEVISVSDGLSGYTASNKASGAPSVNTAIYASAVIGHNAVSHESMDLMSITLRARANNPAEPELSKVSLIDGNGNLTTGIISTEAEVAPKEFSLGKNYPNPFNPTTTMSFSLPTPGNVKLSVFNMLGQEVKTLISSEMEPGTYRTVWNARNNMGQKVASGVYFYRLVVNNKVVNTQKMLLLK